MKFRMWTKKRVLITLAICSILASSSVLFSQMNQYTEAAILTPIESPPTTIFSDPAIFQP